MVEEFDTIIQELTDEEKLIFFMAVMPSKKEILCKDPKAMMLVAAIKDLPEKNN